MKTLIFSLSLTFSLLSCTDNGEKITPVKPISTFKDLEVLQDEPETGANARAELVSYKDIAYLQIKTEFCGGDKARLSVADTLVINSDLQAFLQANTQYEGNTQELVIQRLKNTIPHWKKRTNRRSVSITKNGKYYALKINRGDQKPYVRVVTLIYQVSADGLTYTPLFTVCFGANAKEFDAFGKTVSATDPLINVPCNSVIYR